MQWFKKKFLKNLLRYNYPRIPSNMWRYWTRYDYYRQIDRKLGFVQRIIDQLNKKRSNRVTVQVFVRRWTRPRYIAAERGTEVMRAFEPEHNHRSWWWFSNGCSSNVALLRTTTNRLPWFVKNSWTSVSLLPSAASLGKKRSLVFQQLQVQGSEVTPFAVISDKKNIGWLLVTPTICHCWPCFGWVSSRLHRCWYRPWTSELTRLKPLQTY